MNHRIGRGLVLKMTVRVDAEGGDVHVSRHGLKVAVVVDSELPGVYVALLAYAKFVISRCLSRHSSDRETRSARPPWMQPRRASGIMYRALCLIRGHPSAGVSVVQKSMKFLLSASSLDISQN